MSKHIELKRRRLKALMSSREKYIDEIMNNVVQRIIKSNAFCKSVIDSQDESQGDAGLEEQRGLDNFLKDTFKNYKGDMNGKD